MKSKTAEIIHKGIEFAKTLNADNESYLSGAGFGYSCGYQAAMEEYASQAKPSEGKGLLTELIDIRNKLYDSLPVGDINAFELLQMIKWHLNDIDNFCSRFNSAWLEPADNVEGVTNAVEFAEWIEKEIYTKGMNGKWYKIPGTSIGEKSQFTTKQLYNLFIQSLLNK